jgi:hypothetical protein
MRLMLRSSVFVAAVACALLAACGGGSVPNQVLTKPAPVIASPPVAHTNGPWLYRQSTQRQSFTVDQQAVIVVQLDSSVRSDTISTHAELAFTAATAGAANGSVSAFTVQGAGRAAATPAGVALPFLFRSEYSASGQQFDFTAPRDAAPCSSVALAAVQSLRDVWMKPPDTLRVGAAWSDSSSYVLCRDGIPIRAITRRTFRVAGFSERNGQILLAIARTSRTTSDGGGSQFGESVSVSGTGSGLLNYELDPASGEVRSASGNATLDLTLRSRVRTQVVHQTAAVRIGRS